jgi:hypothetical protein
LICDRGNGDGEKLAFAADLTEAAGAQKQAAAPYDGRDLPICRETPGYLM